MKYNKPILLINRNGSKCGMCGHSANWSEDSHITRLGLSGIKEGCGVKCEYVSSEYMYMDEDVASLRPDLIPMKTADLTK